MGPAQGTLGLRLQPGLWSSFMVLVMPHWVGVTGALCSSLAPRDMSAHWRCGYRAEDARGKLSLCQAQ